MYGDTGLNTEINHGQALHPRHISLVVGINFIRLSIDRAYEGGGGWWWWWWWWWHRRIEIVNTHKTDAPNDRFANVLPSRAASLIAPH